MTTPSDTSAVPCILCGAIGRDHLVDIADQEAGGDQRRWGEELVVVASLPLEGITLPDPIP
jgi:hypothetical protein